jgi:hypothetical protein
MGAWDKCDMVLSSGDRTASRTVLRSRQANDGKDFSATQANVFLDGFTFRNFAQECCAEHARRMEEFDPALLRPRFLPTIARMALSCSRLRTSIRPAQHR